MFDRETMISVVEKTMRDFSAFSVALANIVYVYDLAKRDGLIVDALSEDMADEARDALIEAGLYLGEKSDG